MHDIAFLQDLAIVLIAAGIVTILFHRFKQPVVLGYIIAGILIGPETPPTNLISNPETIATLSELGVIFLMFSLGLEFSLRKLRAVGATAFIAAAFEIIVMVWLGYEVGNAFGWKKMDSVFLGAILAISSTTIILKALEELGKIRKKFAQQIFGILIIEDMLAIVMLALLSGFATTGSLQVVDVGYTLMKLGAFLVALLVVGLLFVPRFLNYVSRFKSKEMMLVSVIGICFGVSLVTVKLGYSVALGAFLIGAIVAEARQIHQIEHLVAPIRDLFSAVFFVSIGLLIKPALIVQYAWPILIISFVVIVGKIVSCFVGAFVSGNERRVSMQVGMGLAQIGEFSFIIATLGLTLGVTSEFLYPIIVTVSAVTTFTTPYLIRSSDGAVNFLERIMPRGWSQYLDAYTQWVGALGKQSRQGRVWPILRKCGIQVGMNVFLIIAIFTAAAFVAERHFHWESHFSWRYLQFDEVLWLVAMVLSLPMLIAAVRKLQAIGMLLSEISVSQAMAGKGTRFFRNLISNMIFLAALVAMGFLLTLLSSPLLSSWYVLLFLGVILLDIYILFRRSFIRFHARAEGALLETFSVPLATQQVELPMPAILRDVDLLTIPLRGNAQAVGKRIGDLGIRTVCGASIVAIERQSQSIINPGAGEVLQVDDQILLLGNEEQLSQALQMLER